jgi:hypothetical protein
MSVYVLSSDDAYASYIPSSEEQAQRYGLSSDRVQFPAPGDPLLRFEEGFGDANLERKPLKKGDFHTALSDIRLFSQRAVDFLQDSLTSTGRLIPVEILGRTDHFYWYWCTQVVDCLDEVQTRRGPPSRLPIEQRLIISPAFHSERVGDSEIFVVPGQTRQFDLFVTDRFRAKVKAGKLKGFRLGRGRFDSSAWTS